MSFIAGDIMIRMAADVASLKSDMQKAESAVSTAMQNMQKAAKALGGMFAVTEIVAWIKSAIDAGDKADEMAQKVGMSVQELSSLSFAFQTAGVDADGMKTALVKLSKNVFDNEAAFKALGISVKDSSGSYRSQKEILADVAEFFSKLPDGVTKTALATELFGKSGADLIPVLSGGKKGLQDITDEAEKYGLIVKDSAAKASGEFNDVLDMLKKRSEAARINGLEPILPVLGEIGRQFALIGNATKDGSDEIALWQKIAIIAAEAVSIFLLDVIFIARILVGEIKTIALQLKALATLDFDNFTKLGEDWAKKATAMREELDAQDIAILNAKNKIKEYGDELDKTKPKTDENAQAMAEAALKAKELEAQQKAAAEAARKHGEELDKATEAIRMEAAGLSPDFLKKLSTLQELRTTNRLSVDEYNAALTVLINKQPVVKAQMEAERKELELLAQRRLEDIKAYEAKEQKVDAAIKSAEDMITQIDRETKALNMSNTEREISNALLALEKAGLEKGTYAYEVYAEKIKAAVLDRETVKSSIEATKKIEDEWKKTTDSINSGLTDALMRAFESGKGFMDAFVSTLKNAFKTLILEPTIKAIIAPVGGAVGSLFSGNAFAGQGVGGMGSGIGSLISSGMNFLNGSSISAGASGGVIRLGDWLSTSSNNTVAGIGDFVSGNAGMLGSGLGMLGNGFAGYGISKALSGGYSAGNWVNTAAGIASAIPGIGPIAGVVGGLINRAFGMGSKEMKDFGIQGTLSGGSATGQTFQDWFQKGGWFRSDKRGTDFSAMDENIKAALDLGAKGILEQTKAWAEALKLPADQLANVTADFKVKLTSDAKANQAALELVFTGYQTALTDQFAAVIAPFQKAGETIGETMQRLVTLSTFSDSINELGGVFSRIAGASIEARENIISLAGGIDKLMAAAGQFVKDYYSTTEQAGLQAKGTIETLKALGIDGSTLSSRDDFRKLVESIDISTAQGQQQVVALLQIAPQFAQLGDYLKDQKKTLEEVAKQAPAVAILDQMLPEQKSTTDAVTDVSEQIKTGNLTLERIVDAINTGNVSIVNGLASMVTAQANLAVAQAEANRIAAESDKKLSDISSSQNLSGSKPTYSYDIGSGFVSVGQN